MDNDTVLPVHIVALHIENVKRIVALDITPEGDVICIGGDNGAGKSSLIDSIAMVIGGKNLCPPHPIREGEATARIVATLTGGIQVTRTFKIDEDGGTSSKLTITSTEGLARSPQTLLDALYSAIAFDPLVFTRMSPAEQLTALKAIAGISTDDLDARITTAYEERRQANRVLKERTAHLEAMPFHAETPSTLTDPVELMHLRDTLLAIARLRATIEDLSLQLLNRKQELDSLESTVAGKPQNLAEVDASIQRLNQINAQVQENAARTKEADGLRFLTDQTRALDDEVNAITRERTQRITSAKMPIEGLSFSETAVLYNNLPFEQASAAEQLRISVAIGLATNPRLRVLLIRDGSLLDSKNLAMIAQMARAADAQVWIERVGDGPEVTVVLEDGHIKEAK